MFLTLCLCRKFSNIESISIYVSYKTCQLEFHQLEHAKMSCFQFFYFYKQLEAITRQMFRMISLTGIIKSHKACMELEKPLDIREK